MSEMKQREVLTTLRRRPAVHRLTSGAFLQEPVWIDQQTYAVPLRPMGFQYAVNYTVYYNQMIADVPIDQQAAEQLGQEGADTHPIVTFIHYPSIEDDPVKMEASALPHLDKAEQLIGWMTGDYLSHFAFVVVTTEGTSVRLTPPASRRRQMFGAGHTGATPGQNVRNLGLLVDSNERFAFALSLYRDALHEKNVLFKIARFFAVLESLAYALKADGVGSRTAVRRMLGLEGGAVGEITFNGRKVRYERIELAGRLRDKLFHGAPFERTDLKTEWRDSFDLLVEQPVQIANSLMSDCEVEFARWGSNVSVARLAAELRRADNVQV
jgi:hypothetical protein